MFDSNLRNWILRRAYWFHRGNSPRFVRRSHCRHLALITETGMTHVARIQFSNLHIVTFHHQPACCGASQTDSYTLSGRYSGNGTDRERDRYRTFLSIVQNSSKCNCFVIWTLLYKMPFTWTSSLLLLFLLWSLQFGIAIIVQYHISWMTTNGNAIKLKLNFKKERDILSFYALLCARC